MERERGDVIEFRCEFELWVGDGVKGGLGLERGFRGLRGRWGGSAGSNEGERRTDRRQEMKGTGRLAKWHRV